MPLASIPPEDFTLDIADHAKVWARRWMWLGVVSLAVAGILAIILVGARSPGVQQMLPFADAFHTALVVHVDLSVLVWFLVGACVIWSLQGPSTPYLMTAAFGCFAGGTALIVIAPWVMGGTPLQNNYVPVLINPVFFLGLGLLYAGTLVMIFRTLKQAVWKLPKTAREAQAFAPNSAAIVTLFALAACVWAKQGIGDTVLDPETFYERLFWGAGHILQFTHTTLVAAVWIWLAAACGARIPLGPKALAAVYFSAVLIVAPSIYAYNAYDILSVFHTDFFTQQMRHFGGLAALIVGGAVTVGLVRLGKPRPGTGAAWSALVASLVLFAFGGGLGWMIAGTNVVIPAHYHGSIVGVTLAYMGLFYWLAPKVGGKPTGKLAVWQLWVYGGGQLMHITGLAWSGGYGVLRKTPGLMETSKAKLQMGIMGAGGAVAIVGGILFVIAMWRALRKPS